MIERPVREIGRITDFFGRDVIVGVDYNAVTIDGPKDAALGPEVRDDFMKLLMQADTEAKAWADAEHAAAIEEERLDAADIAADRRDRLDID